MTRSLTTEVGENFYTFLSGNFGSILLCAVAGVAFLLLATCTLREVCYRRYGIDLRPRIGGSLRSRQLRQQERQQVLRDEDIAMQIQTAAQQEDQRTAAMMQKRKERRTKYEVLFKSHQMVISEDDLFIQNVPYPTMEARDIETGSRSSDTESDSEGFPGEGSSEEGSDGPPGIVVQDSHTSRFESDRIVLVRLPIKTEDGTPCLIDAHCSICLTDYEEGDTIIWAARKACPHAFHDECIMTWLSKGKKRCPCCRHWFVPGLTVDETKVVVARDSLVDHEETMESGEHADPAVIEALRASHNAASVSSPLALKQEDSPLVDPDIDSELAMTTQPEVS